MNMPKGYITRRDALALMRQKDGDGFPVPFKLRFVKCDVDRGTGGQLCEVDAVLHHSGINKAMWRNATRNIHVVGAKVPTAVHVYLMTRINGKAIL